MNKVACNSSSIFPAYTTSFASTKARARDKIYYDHRYTFYCNCSFAPSGKTSGIVSKDGCGYEFRKNEDRGNKIEWEHIVPASFIGKDKSCWNQGDPKCSKKGRECCDKTDDSYKSAANDLHNLVPAVGELNADRSDYKFGIIKGEPRLYGQCDFEVDGQIAEPAEYIRGDIARIYLYMHDTHNIPLNSQEISVFHDWMASDPVDGWEIIRDTRICNIQGNSNHYITDGLCSDLGY